MHILTQGYKNLMDEFKASFDGHDSWGSTMEWWFAVAETLYHTDNDVPGEWAFHDSPMHDSDKPSTWANDSYATDMTLAMFDNEDCDENDLILFGRVLHKYAGVLRAAGKDY